ncbi:hypothetical protein E2C01_097461 [Portunus trituberculatus]|uniref:Uncharacterized protein n=1 Tax=Portunus trituberculatus TaxID=210409 RepID=A0A5B7JV85_PORTR|nr:hypothetical protein [Portunus trituberculatus]
MKSFCEDVKEHLQHQTALSGMTVILTAQITIRMRRAVEAILAAAALALARSSEETAYIRYNLPVGQHLLCLTPSHHTSLPTPYPYSRTSTSVFFIILSWNGLLPTFSIWK